MLNNSYIHKSTDQTFPLYWSTAEYRALCAASVTSNCALSCCLPSWGAWCQGGRCGWGLRELYPATRGGTPGHHAGSYPWTEGRSSTPHSAADDSRTNKLNRNDFVMQWAPFFFSFFRHIIKYSGRLTSTMISTILKVSRGAGDGETQAWRGFLKPGHRRKIDNLPHWQLAIRDVCALQSQPGWLL